jgi:ANTAR domain
VPAGGAQILADAVVGVLLHDPLAFTMVSGTAGQGWSSRALVLQAAGIVAGQLGIGIADALAILRSHAFATDSQLRDVARNVVDRELDLSGN